MNTKNLPPEGRLTDQQRAVMRTNLMAATHEKPKTGRRWLTPLAVAASVAVLAGVGVAGTNTLLKNDDGGTTAVPAATGGGTPSANPPTTEEIGRMSGEELGRWQCDESVIYQDGLENPRLVDSVSYDAGTTYLYEAEGQWWYCDDWQTRPKVYVYENGERIPAIQVPVISVAQSVDDRSITKADFTINTVSVPDQPQVFAKDTLGYDGGYHMQLLAGGQALDGVSAINYAFPNGEVVDATITDKMWQMVYVKPSDKPYVGGWSAVVTVTKTDGSTQQFELTDVDTPALANSLPCDGTVGGC